MESKRITGTEMEWAVMVPGVGNSLRQLEATEITSCVRRWLTISNVSYHGSPVHCYLANGSRFYSDVGDHREYATPEDDSFEGTFANELAGEQIMARSMDYLRNDDDDKQHVSLVKRVIDDKNNGSGYHISYSANAQRMKINEDDLALFGVFAATRSVLFGAGALLANGKFILGQKAYVVNQDFSAGTTTTKPVVNLRNEPHADSSKYLRVHDTSSDPNMSPWSGITTFGAGSLVLKLIEEGRRLEKLRFADSLTFVTRRVAEDTTLSERFKMTNGRGMTALGVQLAIIKEAKRLKNCSDEEQRALYEWEKATRDLQQDPRLVANRVEWFIRKRMLEQQHKKHGWGWDSQELRSKDRQFSEFMGGGIGQALRETVWAPYMPSQNLIDDRIHNPPNNTRARVRGLFIDFAHQHKIAADSLLWDSIKFQGETYRLKDPFNSQHAELESAVKKAEQIQKLNEAIPA